MKNIAFILLILAAVCFANCAGDYEAEPRGTNGGKARQRLLTYGEEGKRRSYY